MLILAKAAMALMLGFVLSIITGVILIPLLRKLHFGQSVSLTLGERHLKKNGTPTIGGLIFIIPTIISLLLLWFRGSIEMTSNLMIVLFVFISYALLGLADDLLKIVFKNNKGLSIMFKLLMQTVIALVFFYIFIRNGGVPEIRISAINLYIYMGWTYGLFILFLLVGSSNAVNITDGLDGLAAGLSSIYFITIGIVIVGWMHTFDLDAIITFIMLGATLGFLCHNFNPAKIFMGDSGSMFLGYMISIIALLGFKNVTLTTLLVPICLLAIPIMDTLFAILRRIINKKPIGEPDKQHLHHQLLNLNLSHRDTVLVIYFIDILFATAMLIYILYNRIVGIVIYAILFIVVLLFILKTNIIVDHSKKNKNHINN